MNEVNLTGTLKTYKAIVIYPGDKMPEGYMAVAGTFREEGEVEIALPESLRDKPKLLIKLIDQAERCLIDAFPFDQTSWGGV